MFVERYIFIGAANSCVELFTSNVTRLCQMATCMGWSYVWSEESSITFQPLIGMSDDVFSAYTFTHCHSRVKNLEGSRQLLIVELCVVNE